MTEPNLYEAIGRLTTRATRLENAVEIGCSRLLSCPNTAVSNLMYKRVQRMRQKEKTDLLKELLRAHCNTDDLRSEASTIAGDILHLLKTERGAAAHSRDSGKGERLRLTTAAGHVISDPGPLLKAAESCDQRRSDLGNFMQKLRDLDLWHRV